MIKTRKRFILSAFSFIISSCLAGSSIATFCQDNNTSVAQQINVTLASPLTDKPIETTAHKKRMRKPSAKKEKTKRGRTFMDFDYEELAHAKDVQRAKGNIPVTIKYIEQMMKLCDNINLLADNLLEIADLFFIDNQFQKATALYTQYCALYPGSEKQEYALYRSITSSFACILSVDRDQTITEETLARTELFLKQDHFTQYKDEVAQIQTQCYEQLAASECNICNFYVSRGKLPAAEKRLKKIRSYWLPKLPTLEPTIIALETQIIEQKEAIALLNVPHTKLAHNTKTKHMADRF